MVETVTRKHSQGATFNRMVTAALTLIIGVLVFNQVLDSLPGFDYANRTALIDRGGIIGPVESAFQLAPVVLIVLVAGLILAQVTGFGRN